MADHHQRAGKLQQGIFERTQGFDVQVVGRFIQHQHIAARNQGLGQVQPAAFPARQHADSFLLVGAVEVEAPAIGPAGHLELADVEYVEPARHVFPDRFFVGQVVAVLVNEGHLDRGADLDFAAIGFLRAGDHTKQR